uniref:Uncharacterized protein n=1 Tax=Pristionchus pacificus TaxID=54126 RepID=A0A2A6C680_PRIPA|eukprot:PDM73685.1 hypothetical protein PRIPAC_41041 [Pristionchus pacificus]
MFFLKKINYQNARIPAVTTASAPTNSTDVTFLALHAKFQRQLCDDSTLMPADYNVYNDENKIAE